MNDELKIKNNELGGKMNYRYRNDEEMKDSGVEWIGKIPKEWIISKFKYFYTFGMGETILKENLSDNGLPVYSATEEDSVFGKYNNAKLILKEGDIIIPARGNSIGAVKIAKDKCTCTQTTIYGKKIGTINEKFIYYFMKGNRNHLFYFDQTAIPQITTNQVKENMLVYGDMVMQDKIAKFLDEKTAQFDSIISKKEALIEKLDEAKKSLISEVVTGKVKVVKTDEGYELLERKKEEMKDSGVEWIENIPSDFLVSKMKYVSDVIDPQPDHRAPRLSEGEGFPYIGIRDLNIDGTVNVETARKVEEDAIIKQENAFKIENGDIVFGKVGTLGNPKFIKTHTRIALSATLVLIKSKSNISNRYLRFVLDSNIIDKQMQYLAQGSTRPALGIQQIRKFDIPYPKLDEQKAIAEFLDYKVEKIEYLCAITLQQIERLKEAKQSLISEAVTGKIEILD